MIPFGIGAHSRPLAVFEIPMQLPCLRSSDFPCLQCPENSLSSAVPIKGGPVKVTGPNRNIEMSESTINVADFKAHENDTGSADYQVALLTQRITHLTEHLSLHKKDNSSRRGLLKLVAQRRKLLDYVKANSEERYQKLLQGLNLRK